MTSAFVLFGHSSLYNDITVNEILKTSIIVLKNQNFLCKYFNEYANPITIKLRHQKSDRMTTRFLNEIMSI